jgi:hypothetical protein
MRRFITITTAIVIAIVAFPSLCNRIVRNYAANLWIARLPLLNLFLFKFLQKPCHSMYKQRNVDPHCSACKKQRIETVKKAAMAGHKTAAVLYAGKSF